MAIIGVFGGLLGGFSITLLSRLKELYRLRAQFIWLISSFCDWSYAVFFSLIQEPYLISLLFI